MSEELGLVTGILDAKGYRYEEHTELYGGELLKNFISHSTIYVPSKDNFIFFISFDTPFDGYRFGKPQQYDSRHDKDISEIEKLINKQKEVKKRGRKRV